MTIDYPTDEVPATPEYVLELFRDVFREWDEPIDILSFETTVSAFAGAWNDTILFWWEIAKPLNQFTGLNLPIKEWKAVLCPVRERTVRDLCEFVAERMGNRPSIRPWHHISGDCLPAGAFLTVRAILTRSFGPDPREITPSTALEPYFQRYGISWLGELCRLAPGRVPSLVEKRWFPIWSCLALGVVSVGMMLIGKIMGKGGDNVWLAGCLLLFFTTVISLLIHQLSHRQYSLDGLLTFRDLSCALARQEPRWRIKPSS